MGISIVSDDGTITSYSPRSILKELNVCSAMKSLTDTERIKTFIEAKYPYQDHASTEYKGFIYTLWQNFQQYGLQDTHFISEFTSGNQDKFLQRYTEMFFAWHFSQLGFSLVSEDKGPDLFIEHDGQRIWVEIITPRLNVPKGETFQSKKVKEAILDYLAPPPTDPKKIRAKEVPTEQILLRWTAALKEKHTKILGYIEAGIIQPQDICIVAVNSILLGHFGFIGISQLPNPVEATFAVGPIQVRINHDTHEITNSAPSYRPSILNHNQSLVPADSFLNPSYKAISALMAIHVGLNYLPQLSDVSPLTIVHNPLAVTPLPICFFEAREEYVAKDEGEFWEISDVLQKK